MEHLMFVNIAGKRVIIKITESVPIVNIWSIARYGDQMAQRLETSDGNLQYFLDNQKKRFIFKHQVITTTM
jgi:hypothetical protein